MGARPGIAGFAPPANLPNINFNAPIIRLGTSVTRQNPLPTQSSTAGKAAGSMAREVNELLPPTVEEQLKTVFVGGIPKGVDDEWMERILRVSTLDLNLEVGIVLIEYTGDGDAEEVDESD